MFLAILLTLFVIFFTNLFIQIRLIHPRIYFQLLTPARALLARIAVEVAPGEREREREQAESESVQDDR